jgi:hypothetical protein
MQGFTKVCSLTICYNALADKWRLDETPQARILKAELPGGCIKHRVLTSLKLFKHNAGVIVFPV